MKPSIHPEYKDIKVTCSCGNIIQTQSTLTTGTLSIEVCSNCHPFYTGKQKTDHVGGRVQRFRERYGMAATTQPDNKKQSDNKAKG